MHCCACLCRLHAVPHDSSVITGPKLSQNWQQYGCDRSTPGALYGDPASSNECKQTAKVCMLCRVFCSCLKATRPFDKGVATALLVYCLPDISGMRRRLWQSHHMLCLACRILHILLLINHANLKLCKSNRHTSKNKQCLGYRTPLWICHPKPPALTPVFTPNLRERPRGKTSKDDLEVAKHKAGPTCTAMVQSCRAFRGWAKDRWQAALLVSSFTKTSPSRIPPSFSTFRPCIPPKHVHQEHRW